VFFPTPERLKAPILGVDWRPDQADLEKLMAAVPRQPLTLGVVLAGDREASGWWGDGRPAGWADAVQVVREVARVLGVDVEVRQATRAPWHPGRCAQFLVNGVELGHAGELHPAVCAAYGVPALKLRGTFLACMASQVRAPLREDQAGLLRVSEDRDQHRRIGGTRRLHRGRLDRIEQGAAKRVRHA